MRRWCNRFLPARASQHQPWLAQTRLRASDLLHGAQGHSPPSRQAGGLERSSRLVLQLHGLGEQEDGAALAEELVYSRRPGAPAACAAVISMYVVPGLGCAPDWLGLAGQEPPAAAYRAHASADVGPSLEVLTAELRRVPALGSGQPAGARGRPGAGQAGPRSLGVDHPAFPEQGRVRQPAGLAALDATLWVPDLAGSMSVEPASCRLTMDLRCGSCCLFLPFLPACTWTGD